MYLILNVYLSVDSSLVQYAQVAALTHRRCLDTPSLRGKVRLNG